MEFQAHGGPLILRRILDLALAAGARGARPGEMTLRAFLNGRLDLAQAEAVMALIGAESEAGRRLALRQLAGRALGEGPAGRVPPLWGRWPASKPALTFPKKKCHRLMPASWPSSSPRPAASRSPA